MAQEWCTVAWNSERANAFFEYLHEDGYTCQLFSYNHGIGAVFGNSDNLIGKFENFEESERVVDSAALCRLLLKYSSYRYAPYILKPELEVLESEFDGTVSYLFQDPIHANETFYETLLSEGLSIQEDAVNSFTVQYLQGIHHPRTTGALGTYQENATMDESAQGLMVILNEYFEQMKNLGVYDDATIIILADHGPWSDILDDPQPIFFIKRAGETHDEMSENSAPIALEDFQATVMSCIGVEDEMFGSSIFDWEEGDERSRVLFMRSPGNVSYYGYTYTTDKYEIIPRIEETDYDILVDQMSY